MSSEGLPELFTVNVIKVKNEKESSRLGLNDAKLLDEYPNMVSARIIRNNMVEFQHSNLVGAAVKFKTIVNYSRCLEASNSLGIFLTPQDSYKIKPDSNDH